MVICVPEGDEQDATRAPGYYARTFDYLRGLGLCVIQTGMQLVAD